MRSIEEIQEELDMVDKKMILGCYHSGRDIDTTSLRVRREELQNEFYLRKRTKLVAFNDELDIYEEEKFKDHFIYYVVLHDTYSITGFISAMYDDGPHSIGNIGYEIYPKFRGHGYTRKALELLCDTFLERGMEESVIVINASNIPSIKTTEGFGGVLVSSSGRTTGRNVYSVDIKQKVLSKRK